MRNRSDRTKGFVANLHAKAAVLDPSEEGPSAKEGSAVAPPAEVHSAKGLGQRMAVLGDAFVSRRPVVHFNPDNVRLDPDRCRPWEFHDRDTDGLNETSCADLIAGFREAGRQTTPGLVRPLRDDPEGCMYEVVVGVRRWWVCKHLGWQFEAEIRNPDDGEAFLVSDVENRSRADLSDWERAWKYRRALAEIYSSEGVAAGRASQVWTQEELAAHLGQSPAWLTRLLYLTELPAEVVAAFPDKREILVNHGRRLKPYLDDPEARTRVVEKAMAIASGAKRSAKAVVAALERAGEAMPNANTRCLGSYAGAKGLPAVHVMRKGRRDLRIDVTTSLVSDVNEVLALIERAMQDHF